jgi:hypothetical protein
VLIFCLFSLNSNIVYAEMASENYRIRSSVHSAGGVRTDSTNFQVNGTIGQPSPLMDPLEPPLSDTYDLYPGFWYTIGVSGDACPGDFNGDGDVDGSDLAEFIFDSGGLGVDIFAANFGKENCP